MQCQSRIVFGSFDLCKSSPWTSPRHSTGSTTVSWHTSLTITEESQTPGLQIFWHYSERLQASSSGWRHQIRLHQREVGSPPGFSAWPMPISHIHQSPSHLDSVMTWFPIYTLSHTLKLSPFNTFTLLHYLTAHTRTIITRQKSWQHIYNIITTQCFWKPSPTQIQITQSWHPHNWTNTTTWSTACFLLLNIGSLQYKLMVLMTSTPC